MQFYLDSSIELDSTTDKKMKKCPYCAEQIQDEAIVCRYCSRDLVNNVEAVAASRKIEPPQAPPKIGELTLTDFDSYMEKLGNSYPSWPSEVMIQITAMLRSLMADTISAIVGEYLKSKLWTDREMQANSTQATAIAFQWASLCFAVGIEISKGNIKDSTIPWYLNKFLKPFATYFYSWINLLLAKGKINPKRAETLTQQLNKSLTDTATRLAKYGAVQGKSFKQKDTSSDQSSFLSALHLLDI